MSAVGQKGMASKKIVDIAWVITIPLTKPILLATRGAATAVNPIMTLDAAMRGPEKTSVSLKRRRNHVGISGMIKPAPRPMSMFAMENFMMAPRDFRGSIPSRDELGLVFTAHR